MTATLGSSHDTRETSITAVELDTAAAAVDQMSMPDRLVFLQSLRDGPARALGAGDKWLNLEGVITFFRNFGLGEPGTWVSWVNAGVLEGVGRGVALALDETADDYGNPGAHAWAQYLRQLAAGELATEYAHAQAWSLAKKVGTDYGVALAARHGLTPTPVEQRFLRIAEAYNWAMGNRAPVDALVAFAGYLDDKLAGIEPSAVDRLFSVGSVDGARRGCEIAYAAALIEPSAGSWSQFRPLLGMLPPMFNTLSDDKR
ncbi:MAG: hypothetical protein HOQ24_12865 [Mycobacteriaceae bacterium]|nr:hypothetical protein [Mycobacteriaceae bacterium]